MCQPKQRRDNQHDAFVTGMKSIHLNTESQEIAVRNYSSNKMPFNRFGTKATTLDNECNRNNIIRSPVRLPSMGDSCFDGDDDDSDQESIDSEAILVDTPAATQQEDSDDDDSILSQVLKSAVEITTTNTFQDSDTTLRQCIDDDDISLISIDSKAHSVTSTTSYSDSTSYDALSCGDEVMMGSKKRVVIVRQQNEIHYIPTRREYSLEEIKCTWYQRQEMAAMVKARCLELAAAAAAKRQETEKPISMMPEVESFPEELGSSSLSLSLESPLHAQHLSGAFHRGTCKPTDAQSEARIQAVIEAVMDEQETQWLDEEEGDQDLVAQASMAHSRICARDAVRRAHLDALEAIPIYLEREEEESSSQRRTEQKRTVVLDSRWAAVSSKMAGKNQMFEGSSNSSHDALMAIPKRRGSDHGTEQGKHQASAYKNGLMSMPKRMGSLDKPPDEMDDILNDILSVVSASDFSIDSELEFGGDGGAHPQHHQFDDYEEELAPPCISVSAPSTSVTSEDNKENKKTIRTHKFYFKKDNNISKESSNDGGGFYHKLRRMLKGSKNKIKKKVEVDHEGSKIENKKKEVVATETKNKRRKDSKGTKSKKKKTNKNVNKSSTRKAVLPRRVTMG